MSAPSLSWGADRNTPKDIDMISFKYELEDEKMAHIRTKDGLAEEQRRTKQLQDRNSALTKEYMQLFIKYRDEINY